MELRRTPQPMVVHQATDRELVPDEVLHSMHQTKRVVLDLAGTVLDALRELRILFAPLARQGRSREECLVVQYLQGESGPWRTELLSLSRTFWEQGVTPNSVLVLVPLSRMLHTTAKEALSQALFSGWLQPIKSEAMAVGGTLPTKKRAATTRPVGSKKKPAFFVMRKSLLLCFKNDRADRAKSVIPLDVYRATKVEWETGWVLRLDVRTSLFVSLSSVFQLHTAAEGEIDGWASTIALAQREPTDVFGVALERVVNRASNQSELVPDVLQALVDELGRRISAEPERWRCLVTADAKPPAELIKGLSNARAAGLESHPDMALAGALRSYLLSLPVPLCKPDLLLVLRRALERQDVSLATSAVSVNPDPVYAASLRTVVQLLTLAPPSHVVDVCEMWSEALLRSGTVEYRAVLELLVTQFGRIFEQPAAGGSGGWSAINRRSVGLNPSVVGLGAAAASPDGAGAGSSAGVYATVQFKFEGVQGKGLSVGPGDVVCVFRELPSGWSYVSRMSDGAFGVVPSSYLTTIGPLPPVSPAASQSSLSPQNHPPPPLLSPRELALSPGRSPSTTTDAREERLLAQYTAFEQSAVAGLQEERRAKAIVASWLDHLERQLSGSQPS